MDSRPDTSPTTDADTEPGVSLRLPTALQPATALLTNPLVLISPFFLWGTAMVAMKGVMSETSPLFLASVRLLPAGILVVLVSIWLGREQPKGWQAWLWICLFALIDGTLFQGFLARGLERTGAGLGSVMIDSQPLAVAVMARFLFKEWIGPWGWSGLAIGLLGISFIGLPDEWVLALIQGRWFDLAPVVTLEQEIWSVLFQQGEWLMLMAALSMAVGTILIRFVAKVADPIAATGWHMILGGVPLVLVSALSEPTTWQGVSVTGWLEISYATVFGSAIAYGIFFYLAAQGNLTSLSALTFLTPVFALFFSTLFLAESLSQLQWIGVLFTLLSIYLINQRAQMTVKLAALRSRLFSSPLSPDAHSQDTESNNTASSRTETP